MRRRLLTACGLIASICAWISPQRALAQAGAGLIETFGAAGSEAPNEPEPQSAEEQDLTTLDLSELLELDVTVVSRRSESLASAPAAVYVITGEELRRSGHASIQEALRMVPGIFVSHWDDTEWDVTARGFGPGLAQLNLAYLNQMLVMVDGVVVYTPLFAGMRWSLQDIDLEDVERIEVIRGPSGILWGANAFHGLIHVITKRASDTQGVKASGRISNEGGFATLRYGGRADRGWSYRTFLRSNSSDGLAPQAGSFPPSEADPARFGDWGIQSAGATFDWLGDDSRSARIWTRVYDYAENYPDFGVGPDPVLGENDAQGGQLGLSFEDSERGELWRAFYTKDLQDYREIGTDIDIDYASLEYRRQLDLSERQRLQFGLGYEGIFSEVDYFDGFAADSTRQNNVRVFASDEFRFPEQRLSVALGLVALYNTFTGGDLQPSLRVGFEPGELGYFWASASRAVRVPSIEEQVVLGGLDQNESVIASEFGWRRSFGPGFSIDATLYYNDYRDVRFDGFDPGLGEPFLDNSGSGYARGGELAVDASPLPGWTLRGAYSYHWSEHGPVTPEGDLSLVDGQYPRHLFNLRSYVDLGRGFELDLATYVAEDFEPEIGSESWRSDLRLGWNPRPDLAWSLGVQSFHDARYLEFPFLEIRRLFYLQVSWSPGAGRRR